MTVRNLAEKHFGGNASSAIRVVIHTHKQISDADAQTAIAKASKVLDADSRISQVIASQAGTTISPDGSTAVILAGPGVDPNEMVRVADDLKGPREQLSTRSIPPGHRCFGAISTKPSSFWPSAPSSPPVCPSF